MIAGSMKAFAHEQFCWVASPARLIPNLDAMAFEHSTRRHS